MDEIIQELKRRAIEIKDEDQEFANSAERIGQWLFDIVNKLGITVEEMKKIIEIGTVIPEGGWKKENLSETLQMSLDKADTALQKHQSLEGYVKEDADAKFKRSVTIEGTFRLHNELKLGGSVKGIDNYRYSLKDVEEIEAHNVNAENISASEKVQTNSLNVQGQSSFRGNVNMNGNNIEGVQSITVNGTSRLNGDTKTKDVAPNEDNKSNLGAANARYKKVYTRIISDGTNEIHVQLLSLFSVIDGELCINYNE